MTKRRTVLLTGISGFIAKHIALKLLNAGYDVVGSLRSLSRADEVRAALTPHLSETVDLDKNLRFIVLDLGKDEGWEAATQGVDILMHTASPFPMVQPKNEDDLIRPAVDGAIRALKAAHNAGIRRLVMTSSAAAVMEGELPAGKTTHDEDDWSDLTGTHISPYAKSKTMAERAAWDYVKNEAPGLELTVINPVLVIGPPLDKHFGTSVEIIQRLLRAKDPMLPNFGMPIVDVRDIAEMHLRALKIPASIGKRFIGVHSFMWFRDIALALKDRFQDRKIVTRKAPDFVVRLLAIFDKSVRQIVPSLGKTTLISGQRAKDVLEMDFTPARQSIEETASFLIENDLVG